MFYANNAFNLTLIGKMFWMLTMILVSAKGDLIKSIFMYVVLSFCYGSSLSDLIGSICFYLMHTFNAHYYLRG